MATKPKGTYREKLLKLADDWERRAEEAAHPFYEKAKALRFAAEQLNGHLTAKKQADFDETLDQAIALRKSAEPPNRVYRPTESTRGVSVSKKQEMAARQAQLAEWLKPGVPYKVKEVRAFYQAQRLQLSNRTILTDLRAIGAVMHGSTNNAVWTVEEAQRGERKAKKAKRAFTKKAEAGTRARTAKGLDKLAAHEGPMDPKAVYKLLPNLGILAAHGYLAKQGEGYVRTDKVFTP